MINVALTLTFSLVGVAAFSAIGLPLPWLLGPMFACLIAALAGFPLRGTPMISDTMRTILGVAVGASITPAVIDRLDQMALSISFIPLFILLSGAVGFPYFRRIWGFDPATSYYSAMPGGLQDMLIFGEEAGGNPRILSLIHATRVLLVVTALPMAMAIMFEIDLSQPPGAPATSIPVSELLIMVAIGIVGWRIASAVGLFGASILGPLILATVASLTDVLHHRPPAEAILAAQFFIGMGVGVKYVGITALELRRVLTAAAGYTVLLGILSVIFASAVVSWGFAPQTEAILAFAPGGQAEMTVLAIVAGADVAFVVTHHLMRLVVVIVGAPLMRRLFF
ncbi:AbrB family transcriptional regulator [Litoreibacter roseus]|uniref:Monooxygenase n=1 Tax=Litoreibacter roseus TaxID=2601869 RepID=A0A6N6JJ86_9RHOB|nr:AbrB family transcriptional regulator [Litoreibacter roseus]GFE65338.1 monooxygenase [Litoreibacter roseus]